MIELEHLNSSGILSSISTELYTRFTGFIELRTQKTTGSQNQRHTEKTKQRIYLVQHELTFAGAVDHRRPHFNLETIRSSPKITRYLNLQGTLTMAK